MVDGDALENPVVNAVATAVAVLPGDFADSDADGPTLYVGYSGGMDSTVLLHAAKGQFPRVVALHVNHGLHADAADWQRHCARVCKDWQIELRSREVTLAAGNVEAAARAARYDFFEAELGADAVLLLGHHRDDQAETVLLRIAQGRGVIGMPQERLLGRSRLLRPLLGLPRSQLKAYAGAHNLRWVEDPTNADVSLDRNYLRAAVMPALRARWPDIGASIEELVAQRQGVDEMLLAGSDPSADSLEICELSRGPAALAAELLRVWLRARHAVAPSGRALRSFLAQLQAGADRQPALDLNVGTLRRYHDRIYHVPQPPQLLPSYPLELPGSVRLPHGVLNVARASGQGFAANGPVSVVFREDRQAGRERLLLRGHRRDPNKLLQEAGIPPWQRGSYPLLADADGIVAIPAVGWRDFEPATASSEPSPLWEVNWQPTVR